eukprot:gene20539-22559_t
MAILHPFSYRVIGMHTKAVYALFTSIWILSGLMSLIYLWLGFHSSLVIFASVTVTLSFVVMFATCVIYYCRLIRKPRRIGRKAQPRIKNENETVITPTSVGNDPPCANQGSLPVAVKKSTQQRVVRRNDATSRTKTSETRERSVTPTETDPARRNGAQQQTRGDESGETGNENIPIDINRFHSHLFTNMYHDGVHEQL